MTAQYPGFVHELQ